MRLLSHIKADEVSPVAVPANRRRFLILKADSFELDDVLSVPHPHEGAVTDVLRKSGVSEEGMDAAVRMLRLSKGFEDELPDAFRFDVDTQGKEHS